MARLVVHARGADGAPARRQRLRHDTSFYAGGPPVPGVLGLNVWGAFKGWTELPSPVDPRLSLLSDEKAFTGNATLTWTPDARQRIDLSYGAGFEERWRSLAGTVPPGPPPPVGPT